MMKKLIKKVLKDSKNVEKDFEIKWQEKELKILNEIKANKQ